jgi:hypothetical protein
MVNFLKQQIFTVSKKKQALSWEIALGWLPVNFHPSQIQAHSHY